MKAEKGAVNRLPAHPTPPAVWGRNVQFSAAICIVIAICIVASTFRRLHGGDPPSGLSAEGFGVTVVAPGSDCPAPPQEHRLNREVRLMP